MCWGDNRYGQSSAPDGHFTAISADAVRSCGIRTDRTAVCWGSNGQSGVLDGHFTAISTTSFFGRDGLRCAIKTDETVQCWNWTSFLPDGVQLVQPLATDTADDDAAEAEVARLVNKLRQSLGLAPLSHDTELASAARRWSRTMRDTGQFIHDPLISLQGSPGCVYVRENIATASGTTITDAVQLVFDGWVASPGHYANMTDPTTNRLGVGVAVDGSSFWFTQRFEYCP